MIYLSGRCCFGILLFDVEFNLVSVSLEGIYSVELVNDSLYEWHVKIRT